MRTYALVSGVVFAFLACAQLARAVFQVPVRAATFDVPVWMSWCAVVFLGAMAVWAFRSARPTQP